jgi:hypothetical protein
MDGADHFRLRKAMRAGVSKAVVEDRLDEVFALGRKKFGEWNIGTAAPGETACQHLIGEQIAHLTVSTAPMDVLDDLLAFEYRALLVHVFGLLPKFTLRTPRMKRYKARVMEFYTHIHATHTPAQRQGERRDLADDLFGRLPRPRVVDRYMHATPRQPECRLTSETRATTRDQCHPPVQVHRHLPRSGSRAGQTCHDLARISAATGLTLSHSRRIVRVSDTRRPEK